MLRVVVKNIGGNKGTANVKASIAGDPYSFLIPQQITLDIGESGEVGFIVSISQSITETRKSSPLVHFQDCLAIFRLTRSHSAPRYWKLGEVGH